MPVTFSSACLTIRPCLEGNQISAAVIQGQSRCLDRAPAFAATDGRITCTLILAVVRSCGIIYVNTLDFFHAVNCIEFCGLQRVFDAYEADNCRVVVLFFKDW